MIATQIQSLIAERQSILDWQAIAKKREMELRIMICNALVPKPIFGKNKGLFNGNPFIIDYPQKLEVDPASIENVLLAMEGAGDNCIKREPKLSKSEYNKLPDHLKKVLEQGLIMKPGTVTLEI